jgi:hypothetical protein
MGSRRAIFVSLAIAVGVAVAMGAPNALAGNSQAPRAQLTHPQVKPRVGGRHQTFELSFTLAQTPGVRGFEYTDYRAVVSAPAHTRASCSPTQPGLVTSGTQGELRTVALHPPAHAWCRGSYDVTVYMQVIDRCPPPIEPAPRILCPVLALGLEPAPRIGVVNTGATHFTVR